MAESNIASVLDKIKPGVDLLEEIIRLGRSLIQGLMDKVTCQHWIQDPVIEMLCQPLKCFS
jgi:hypothetical protein